MTENEPMFRTTGRRMSGQLERALDNVTGKEREHTARALEVHEGALRPLLRALALELRLSGLREYEVITAAEESLAASDEPERPYPPSPTPGLELWFDPATGTFSETPPGGPDETSVA